MSFLSAETCLYSKFSQEGLLNLSANAFKILIDTVKLWASLVAQTIKRLPTMRETLVRSLGREVPLEKAVATHSSTLAWKIPWTEESSRLQSMRSKRIGHDWATSLHFTVKLPLVEMVLFLYSHQEFTSTCSLRVPSQLYWQNFWFFFVLLIGVKF